MCGKDSIIRSAGVKLLEWLHYEISAGFLLPAAAPVCRRVFPSQANPAGGTGNRPDRSPTGDRASGGGVDGNRADTIEPSRHEIDATGRGEKLCWLPPQRAFRIADLSQQNRYYRMDLTPTNLD